MDRLGDYLLLRRLATGGLCEVYLAEGGSPSREVVIKHLHPELATAPAITRAFLQLGQEAQRLQHPNLLPVLECGQAGGLPYITSPNEPGKTLEAVQEDAREQGLVMPHGLVCSLLIQLCRALYYLHTEGAEAADVRGPVLHRGVRPSNLLLSAEGTLRLMDVGMQRVRQLAALDQPEVLAGRYEYAAPEQCSGKDEGIRSDLFSAGVVLYELISRRRLFRRQSDLATRRALLHDPIAPPSKVAAGIPFELEQIVMRSVARQPAERYAEARQMEQDLLAAARAHGWETRAATAIGFLSLLDPAAARPVAGYDEEEITGVGPRPYQQELPTRVEGTTVAARDVDKATVKVPALADADGLEAGAPTDEEPDSAFAGDEDRTLVQPPDFSIAEASSRPAAPARSLAPVGAQEIEDASIPAAVAERIEEASIPATPRLSAPAVTSTVAPPQVQRSATPRWLMGGLGAVVVLLALGLVLFLSRDETSAGEQATVISEPAGAQVLIDGKLQAGKTPLTIHGLDPQRAYSLVLLAQGFPPFKTHLPPAQGQEPRRIEVRLSSRGAEALAVLVVRANEEGVQVYLDGELQGTAPLELSTVCCAPHAVLVRKDGFFEQTVRLEALAAGEKRVLEIVMEPEQASKPAPTTAKAASRAR